MVFKFIDMKIFSTSQIRKADAYTIVNEPIHSIDLMERAAIQAFKWISNKFNQKTTFSIFCGVGNNGGDGLVIARKLHKIGYKVQVFVVHFSEHSSDDFKINLKRLEEVGLKVASINSESTLEEITVGNVIIDSIFGSGLSKPVSGWVGDLIQFINEKPQIKIAIDIASGLYVENNDENKGTIIQPQYTLSFEFPKLAFMFPKSAINVGEWVILPIGLSSEFKLSEETDYYTIEEFTAKLIRKKANKFNYKGDFGHALIVAGSQGKMGAAVLACKAALKSGAGLVTALVTKSGNEIMQISLPEVMTVPDLQTNEEINKIDLNKFSSIGIGPGIGTENIVSQKVISLLKTFHKPMVIDADALNILSNVQEGFNLLPENSIITPHLGEWRRISGNDCGDFNRLQNARQFSKSHKIIVVLKGAHSAVICPDGEVFFNTTGNPGMATAGSGDVLTGIITGLLAQSYVPKQAAILGVFIHGLSGDLALNSESRESLIATNIIENLGFAFRIIS